MEIASQGRITQAMQELLNRRALLDDEHPGIIDTFSAR